MKKMLSLREAEQETGLRYNVLRILVNQGKIPCIHVGRKVYICSDNLMEFLRGNHKIDAQ